MKKRVILTGLLFMVLGVLSQSALAQVHNTPSSIFKYNRTQQNIPEAGYMTAGDLWDTINPMNNPYDNYFGSAYNSSGVNNYIMVGSPSNWQSPTGEWPSSYMMVNTWRSSPTIMFPMFKATGWPGYNSSNPVRAHDGSDDTLGVGKSSRFMFAMYGDKVPGVNDPTRNYIHPAHFTDQTRTTLVYEAGWPTTAGVDMKLRAIQFTPNTQNLNDFIVFELTMTNTGIVDSNNDGIPDATNNDIDGVTMTYDALTPISVQLSTAGDRGGNRFGAGRTFGYVGSPDPNGDPYDMFVWYANVPATETPNQTVPPAGKRHFGITNYSQLWGYDDIWSGYTWIGVKDGAITDLQNGGSLNDILPTTPDKQTLFGTDPIGKGSKRGWYTSMQWQPALGGSRSNSQLEFHNATATWYDDYGKTTDGGSKPANLSPNPNFFSSGTPDDMTTWVVGNPNARPNGDYKYASEDIGKSAIEQPIWETAWNPQAAQGNFYDGVGFTKEYTFGEAQDPGIGPFQLKVGQSVTFVWVYAVNYRFGGLWDAVKAARWAWGQGWDIRSQLPVPAAPDLEVQSTPNNSAMIRWTDVSGITPVDGYKIWRASQYKRTKYLDEGMRLVNKYQQQQTPGSDITPFLEPVNPLYDDTTIFTGDIQGTYQPAGWGTYQLIANIPNSELSKYADANKTDGYDFAYEDKDAITGFTYWYYVSAYKDGTFTGPLGPVGGDHVESSNFTRNGRNSPNAALATIGMDAPWSGTYPFATRNANFPADGTLAYKNMGAEFTLNPPVAPPDQVKNLITVTPNPYKITGLNDVRNNASSHNINFLNLPADYTLTILDVSGKIVFQTTVTGASNGKYTWDMFSKDGVEVASGLYIYHVSWNVNGTSGEYTGHFAILR